MPRKQKPEPKMLDNKVLRLFYHGVDEERVIVPGDSKITFGPAIPGPMRPGTFEGNREYAVRVYDGPTEKNGLLAVFTGVRSMRMDTIKVSKLVIREAGKEIWKNDEEGMTLNREVKRTRHLVADTDKEAW